LTSDDTIPAVTRYASNVSIEGEETVGLSRTSSILMYINAMYNIADKSGTVISNVLMETTISPSTTISALPDSAYSLLCVVDNTSKAIYIPKTVDDGLNLMIVTPTFNVTPVGLLSIDPVPSKFCDVKYVYTIEGVNVPTWISIAADADGSGRVSVSPNSNLVLGIYDFNVRCTVKSTKLNNVITSKLIEGLQLVLEQFTILNKDLSGSVIIKGKTYNPLGKLQGELIPVDLSIKSYEFLTDSGHVYPDYFSVSIDGDVIITDSTSMAAGTYQYPVVCNALNEKSEIVATITELVTIKIQVASLSAYYNYIDGSSARINPQLNPVNSGTTYAFEAVELPQNW
jgi:hypothetical protein